MAAGERAIEFASGLVRTKEKIKEAERLVDQARALLFDVQSAENESAIRPIRDALTRASSALAMAAQAQR